MACLTYDLVPQNAARYRRALMESSNHNTLLNAPPPVFNQQHPIIEQATSGSTSYTIVITVALIFLLAAALGLHFLIKCALKCSRRMAMQRAAAGRSVVNIEGAEVASEAGFGPYEYKPRVWAVPRVAYGCTDSSIKDWSQAAGDCKESGCAICLSEYGEGEKVRVLPECGHGFHIACVDTWLSLHSSCPTCRHSATQFSALADKHKTMTMTMSH